MAELKLALLGAPSVTLGGQSVVVESRKALALLFYLTITNQRQGRDWLATFFWPEQDQSRARASLRQALWLLRNAGLQPWLVVEQDALELRGDYECDVQYFQAALRANEIDEALALYRADLLNGFSLRDCPEFDQWHFLQADELRRGLAVALEQWVRRCWEDGEYEQGLSYARRWLALDPLHEPAHRYLMRLYAYGGQYSPALRQYEECVRLLEDELGVPPEDETAELYQAIKSRQIVPLIKASRELSAVGQSSPVTHTTALPPPSHNLPLHLTPFVGRKAEIDELAKWVADSECRLVSIIGPGGIGKTRLALQIARHFVDFPAEETLSTSPVPNLFPHGVLFITLNTVESADGIIAAIAEAAGIVFYSNQAMRQQLLEALHERKMLLLLDNFEHLLAHADFVVDLLTHAPNITIMVTSRETLNLQGEWLWSLGGLDVPEESVAEDHLLDYSAVRMFVQSARRIQPHFSLSAEYPNVVQICRLLGGVPMAIELAVAWLRVISCAQVAREISRNLDFLATRLRDVPERHRSIRAVFEHSWRLLTPSEQETLQQLSVFRGGFDYSAAAQVAKASWLDLVALKEKSLLSVNSSGRYTIHELLAQYSAEKLERSSAMKEATLNRFGAYFVNFLYQREAILFGPGQLQAAADIAIELDNIRAAWQWVLQQDRIEEIRRSASAFYFFCQLQSRFLEGAERLQRAQHCLESLQPSTERDLTLAAIYCHLAWLYIRLGEFELAVTVSQRSRELNLELGRPLQHFIAGDPSVPLALVYHIQGDYPRALELAEEALHMAEVQNDTHNLSFIHYALTATNLALGNYEKAHKHVEAATQSTRAVGNRWFLPYILNESGKVARARGNYAEAKSLFQESYEIKQEFSDPEGMAVALNHLGEIAWLQADYEEAKRLYMKALEIYDEINDQGGLAASFRGLGQAACAEQDLYAAKTWFARALKITIKIHYWPLIYSLLLAVGQLLMQLNAQSLAIEALALVQMQPASDVETKARARRQLDSWQSQLPPADFAAAVQRGLEGEVEMLLKQILVQLSPAA